MTEPLRPETRPLRFEAHALSMALLEEKPGVWFEGEGGSCSLSLTGREAALQKDGEHV